MIKIYSARWVISSASAVIDNGAIAIEGAKVVGVGFSDEIKTKFPQAECEHYDESAIIPGLINTHTHLELTAMRGYLENEETNFFAWLRKLTLARLELMTPDDIQVSATWGACEAARAGITAVGDASDSAVSSMTALKEVGLRGVVYQESFGPDPRLVTENFEKLTTKVAQLRGLESTRVKVGVSPHAPYTVCGKQLELISDFAKSERLPLMMHAAESAAEDLLIRDGCGLFAEGLAKRGIEWKAQGISSIQYLHERGVLSVQPLLAHCIRVDERDIEKLVASHSKVAHCPKSNAKLGHGRAPFAEFLRHGVVTGLGSDSVASNNTCDMLEEGRFAGLIARSDAHVSAAEVFTTATTGGSRCLELEGVTGELAEGVQADFAVLSLSATHQVPNYDPVTAAVFSSSGRDVLLTAVGGEEIFRDGVITNVDEQRLKARMLEIARKLHT